MRGVVVQPPITFTVTITDGGRGQVTMQMVCPYCSQQLEETAISGHETHLVVDYFLEDFLGNHGPKGAKVSCQQ